MKNLARHQQPKESVDEYIADYRNAMRNFQYDDNLQMTLILNGLRPEIKAIVMQHLPFQNIEEMSTKAKHVESALKSYVETPNVSNVGHSATLAVNMTREEHQLNVRDVEEVIRKAIEPISDKLHNLSFRGAHKEYGDRRGSSSQGRFTTFMQPGFSRAPSQRFQGRGRGNGDPTNKRCYVCESRFHLRRECPHVNFRGRDDVGRGNNITQNAPPRFNRRGNANKHLQGN